MNTSLSEEQSKKAIESYELYLKHKIEPNYLLGVEFGFSLASETIEELKTKILDLEIELDNYRGEEE